VKERDHLKDLDADDRLVIKIGFKEMKWVGVDWMHLAYHKDKWRAFVNAAMNVRIP
jgi:hypothetical protein